MSSSNNQNSAAAEFPKYLVSVEGKLRYYPMNEASSLQGGLFLKADLMHSVLEADFSLRDITQAEIGKLGRIADRCDELK